MGLRIILPAALHLVHLGRLPLDRQCSLCSTPILPARAIAMAISASVGVHGGGDEGNVEADGAGEAGDGRNVARMDGGVPRHEEDVVEREAWRDG
jgi:hypothetical protein